MRSHVMLQTEVWIMLTPSGYLWFFSGSYN